MGALGKVFGGLAVICLVVGVGLAVYFTSKGTDCPAPPQPPPQPPAPATTTAPAPAPTTGPRVRIPQGTLEGSWKTIKKTGSADVEYAEFLGVPFAQAPVGPLRFKAPRPHKGWLGVRAARDNPPACAQGMNGDVEAGSSEDCLYLNIFTSNLGETGPDKRLPVVVFIHGGMFMGGSPAPSRYGPNYLLPHGVILVTVQYRLGALGFMSLDTEEVPGNAGLKDNVAAVQWVHSNIALFGGDPDRVTIAGQSAGSALAGWLTMLPEMQGRIHGAILMSGTTYHSWDYKEQHVASALRVASQLANQDVTDLRVAEKLFMDASLADLHKADVAVGDKERESQPELPWVPTPERRPVVRGGEPHLIVRDAESYFLDPVGPVIPQLLSNTNAEWRFYYFSNNPNSDEKVDEEMVENISRHVPKDLLPTADTRALLGLPESGVSYDVILDEVRQGIRDAVTATCSLGCTLKRYFDGIWQLTDTHRLAMFRALENKADTYLFKFSVNTEMNSRQPAKDMGEPVAMHTDDLGCVLSWDGFNPSADADLAIRRMSTMWANFIKHGKPIVQTDATVFPVDWLPNKSYDNDVTYMELSKEGFTAHHDSFSGPMIAFWRQLYHKYRTPPTPAPGPAPGPAPFAPARAPGRERGL